MLYKTTVLEKKPVRNDVIEDSELPVTISGLVRGHVIFEPS